MSVLSITHADSLVTESLPSHNNRTESPPDFRLPRKHRQILPLLFTHQGHPQWLNRGTAWVYRYRDQTPELREEFKKIIEGLGVPSTVNYEQLTAAGITFLKPGDALFCRIDDDPKHDWLKVCILTSDFYDTTHILKSLDHVTNIIIGDSSQCSPNKPIIVKDPATGARMLQGGTAFERFANRSKPNQQGKRCYANGISFETGRHVIAPCRNLGGEEDDGSAMRQEINTVSSILAP